MQDIGISSAPSGADLIAAAKGGRSAKQDDAAGKGFQDALTSSLGNGGKSGANANGDAGTVGTGADTDINAAGAATQPTDLATIVSAAGGSIDTGAEMLDPSLANLANPATLTKGAKPSVGTQFPQEASAANLSKSLMSLQQAVPDDTATADATKTTGDADTTQSQLQAANQLDDLAQQLAEVVVSDPSAKTDGDGKVTPVKAGKTLPVVDDGKSLPTQSTQTGSAVSDVLSLLNAQQAAVAPQSAAAVFTGADVKTEAAPDQSLPKIANVATKDASVDAENTMAALPSASDDTAAAQTFRLVRADGRGGSLDMSVSKSSDNTAQVDITASGSGSAQTVTVLDSRRYLGLAANSNSALVTSALGGNKDWSAAMQPGSALTNAASMTSTGKVVNTLKIQLNPDNLGQVTATMRLSGDQLSVDLKVQTGEAYRQLHADQSHMVDALRAQGYQVDSITVSMAASGDQSSDSNRQSGSQGQSQQQSLMNQGQGGDARPKGQNYSGQQANGNDGNRSTGERGVEDGAAGYAQRLRSGDVYL